MANTPVEHRSNILFNLLGALLIIAGIAMVAYGLLSAVQIMRGFDPFRGDGPPVRIADGMRSPSGASSC